MRDGEKIIFFFLDEPLILVGQYKKRVDAEYPTDSTAKFIPYRESESAEGTAGKTSAVAYPEHWREYFNISYRIKQKRTAVLDAISASDIRNCGTKVINPFIGTIPPPEELAAEVAQLYAAM